MATVNTPEKTPSRGAESVPMVFVNPERCIGCRQCEFACAVEHSKSRDAATAIFEDPVPRTRVHVEPGYALATSFPNRCRHCNPAPCQQVCPTAAIFRDMEHQLVLVNPAKCIACAMCAMVCPFDVLTFHALADGPAPRIVAVKCDGCIDRVREGRIPACAEACKVDALVYGNVNDLVREGRLRETRVVLAAQQEIAPEVPQVPGTVEGWREWGAGATKVAGGLQ
jgi:carbon-monoxide dehydrogenase iron sulfur subunit